MEKSAKLKSKNTKEFEKDKHCYYSGLPSPMAYVEENKTEDKKEKRKSETLK